jgi:hypothetical protein
MNINATATLPPPLAMIVKQMYLPYQDMGRRMAEVSVILKSQNT